MPSIPASPRRAPRGRGWALLVLGAYVGGLGWLATLFAALIALWDGTHTVRIESRDQAFAVVLGHDHWHRPDQPHDWITRALTSLAAPETGTSSDHVIRVGTPSLGAQLNLMRPWETSGAWVARGGPLVMSLPLTWAAPPPGLCSGLRLRSLEALSECAALRVARVHVRRC